MIDVPLPSVKLRLSFTNERHPDACLRREHASIVPLASKTKYTRLRPFPR